MTQGLTKLKSKAYPMRVKNVDTDQILPGRYLLKITRDGYGDLLFKDWRYDEDGFEKPDFVLNQERYNGAEILFVGDNFGAGSSREHAVWALKQFGIKVVIAPSFSDIFRNNSYNNGLLVFNIDENLLEELFDLVEKYPDYEIEINLPEEKMILEDGREIFFNINDFVKEKIIKGLDNIGYILDKIELVEKYEKNKGK